MSRLGFSLRHTATRERNGCTTASGSVRRRRELEIGREKVVGKGANRGKGGNKEVGDGEEGEGDRSG